MDAIRGGGWRRVLGGLLCLGAVVGLSGCVSLAGRWTGSELRPETARDQFQLLRPADQSGRLVSADLRLQQDGGYTAELNYDGKVEQSLATWKGGLQGYLAFIDKHGRSYRCAVRRPDDQTIKLVKGIKGTDATLTLKKQPQHNAEFRLRRGQKGFQNAKRYQEDGSGPQPFAHWWREGKGGWAGKGGSPRGCRFGVGTPNQTTAPATEGPDRTVASARVTWTSRPRPGQAPRSRAKRRENLDVAQISVVRLFARTRVVAPRSARCATNRVVFAVLTIVAPDEALKAIVPRPWCGHALVGHT